MTEDQITKLRAEIVANPDRYGPGLQFLPPGQTDQAKAYRNDAEVARLLNEKREEGDSWADRDAVRNLLSSAGILGQLAVDSMDATQPKTNRVKLATVLEELRLSGRIRRANPMVQELLTPGSLQALLGINAQTEAGLLAAIGGLFVAEPRSKAEVLCGDGFIVAVDDVRWLV